MCNMCAKTRKRTRRKRKVSGVPSGLMLQVAGIGGAAFGAGSDGVFSKFSMLNNNPDKVAAAKGAVGYVLANNPFDLDFLDNEYIAEAGKGLMYYSLGQYAEVKLGISSKLSGTPANNPAGRIPADIQNLIAGSDPINYYDTPSAELEAVELTNDGLML